MLMMIKNTEETILKNASLEEKVAFLKQPAAYFHSVNKVEARETHMSWIFFAGDFVYKLKKPGKCRFLDHRTIESRLKDCDREIKLNKKLAADIYIGLEPLTKNKEGGLQLNEDGPVEEWLVKMKRVPEEAMLDNAIKNNNVNKARLKQAAELLINFYKQASPVLMNENEYRKKLEKEIVYNHKALLHKAFKFPVPVIEKVSRTLIDFLKKQSSLFDERVSNKKIIEGHGDLRPEHVCLLPKPAIIDRLEFSRALRILDMAEELSFFAMECEILGNDKPAEIFFDAYTKQTSDNIHQLLILFYKIKKACLRAYLSARHITEQNYNPHDKWLAKANAYIQLAERYERKISK